jgi:4a-hydroxytetrahydrobiopterin dehydratase
MQNNLLSKKCKSCEDKDLKPLSGLEFAGFLLMLPDWKLSFDEKRITKTLLFADFIAAIAYLNKLADIVEQEGHHPDIFIHYNKVVLEMYTHSIGGLSQNDAITAAKIDQII